MGTCKMRKQKATISLFNNLLSYWQVAIHCFAPEAKHLHLSPVPPAASLLFAQVPRWKGDGGHLQASTALARSAGVPFRRRSAPGQHHFPCGCSCNGLGPLPAQLERGLPCCTATSMNTISSASLHNWTLVCKHVHRMVAKMTVP